MPEQALQTAFEIKASCDEISRRLLRWHWEQKPGTHSFEALLQYIEQRRAESPDYYDRLPDLAGKVGWQQLDTTLCMRVLLDPEKDAARPLDMLGNTAHPAAARRACVAVRAARNEAAHASDGTSAAQAALLFSEAIEALEDGYANSAFTEYELAQFYRKAEDFLISFKGGGAQAKAEAQQAAPYVEAPGPAAAKMPAAEPEGKAAVEPLDVPAPMRRRQSRSAAVPAAKKPRSAAAAQSAPSAGKSGKSKKGSSVRGNSKKQPEEHGSRALWVILIIIVAVGLFTRAKSMGLL